MPTSTPAVVSRYFALDRVRDIEGIVALFTADATVIDEGEARQGTTEIRGWQAGAASKYRYTTAVRAVHPTGEHEFRAAATLTGDFPGGTVDLNFDFTVDGDLIRLLEIAP